MVLVVNLEMPCGYGEITRVVPPTVAPTLGNLLNPWARFMSLLFTYLVSKKCELSEQGSKIGEDAERLSHDTDTCY